MSQNRTFRIEDDEYNFLRNCLDWYKAQKLLLKVGAIPCIPNLFVASAQTPTYGGITFHESEDTSVIPPIVIEVIDGAAYPDQCECTQEESAILYNKAWQTLFKVYKTIKDDAKRAEARQTLMDKATEILQ
jgi:hypothetical protein